MPIAKSDFICCLLIHSTSYTVLSGYQLNINKSQDQRFHYFQLLQFYTKRQLFSRWLFANVARQPLNLIHCQLDFSDEIHINTHTVIIHKNLLKITSNTFPRRFKILLLSAQNRCCELAAVQYSFSLNKQKIFLRNRFCGDKRHNLLPRKLILLMSQLID